FVAHRFTVFGLIGMALVVSLVPPLALAALEALIRRFSEPTRCWCHRFIVALLASATALGGINLFLDAALIANGALAVAVGSAIAVLYARKEGVRRFFSILAPAALLFPLHFLVFSPVSELVFARPGEVETATVRSQTPIVFVVFDEFNPTALLTADRRIDDVRFPNFAALANTSHWFPNATGIHKHTMAALPAIVSGRIPGIKLPPPTYSAYPRNLFTWLGNSHRMNVWESVTSLCPPHLCDSTETGGGFDFPIFLSDLALVYAYILVPSQHQERWLPPLDTGWKGFAEWPDARRDGEQDERNAREVFEENFGDASTGRAETFENFVSRIEGGNATLDFLHILLPHGPYQYLNDGSEYASPIEGKKRGLWTDNEYLVALAYQRYLHQLGFVDGLLGKLVARLKEVEKYDESLIVITADHGAAFIPGASHREPTGQNEAAIYKVPLLIKLPGQTEGAVSERYVSNADLLATIADVIGEDPPWETEGVSAVAANTSGVTMPREGGRKFNVSEFSSVEQLDWQIETFGAGISFDSTVLQSEFAGLIGRDITEFESQTNSRGVRLSSDAIQYLASVDRGDGLIPVMFSGELENAAPGARWVALGLNGAIAAVAPLYEKGNEPFHLRAMFPPDAILDGRNEFDAFLIRGDEESPVLIPLLTQEPETYSLARDGGAEVIHASLGKRYRIEPDMANGYVDTLTQRNTTMQMRGWAVDATAGDLPEAVLAQVNGGEIHVGELGLVRPDVAKAFNTERYELSGFQILAPGIGGGELRSIRVFWLSRNGYAGEVSVDPAMVEALAENGDGGPR
ncbi:MAG: sulfatase-like hydrolase/transferase, partial [Rhodospirillaceae bacterium]